MRLRRFVVVAAVLVVSTGAAAHADEQPPAVPPVTPPATPSTPAPAPSPPTPAPSLPPANPDKSGSSSGGGKGGNPSGENPTSQQDGDDKQPGAGTGQQSNPGGGSEDKKNPTRAPVAVPDEPETTPDSPDRSKPGREGGRLEAEEPTEPAAPAAPPIPQAHTVQEGPDFPFWGVDVSRWQHPYGAALDWPLLSTSANGFSFTFVKATEGAGTQGVANLFFDQDVAAARAAGAYVGAYHYSGPGLPVKRDALAEARHAVSVAGIPQVGDLPLVLDLESNPDGLSPKQMARWALTWLREVERLTERKPIFYTYPSFFAAEVAPDPAFVDYPLWIANYGLALNSPTVPAPWTAWTFWQHSAEGELGGTHGFIDLNVFGGSFTELSLLADVSYQGKGVDVDGVSLLGDVMLGALTADGATTGADT